MGYNHPSQATIANTVPVKQSEALINRDIEGYIFAAGILTIEHSPFLSYQYPQYLATAIMDRIGRYEGVPQGVYSWSEMERTRLSAVITSGQPANGDPSATLVTDIASSVPDSDGYWVIGDTVRTESGVQLRVTGTANNGGFQEITVVKTDGTNFVMPGDIADGESIGHIGTVFPEYSDAPKGRLFLPDQREQFLQKMRRSCYFSGDALTSKTWFNGKSWCYEQELIEMDEFARDSENSIMFETLSAPGTSEQTCDGIVTSILRGGVVSNYAGPLTEDYIMQHITRMRISSPANEYVVFAGAVWLEEAHKALRDYHIGGGVDFGAFATYNMVGISLNAYKFANTTIYFVHYSTFDDTRTLPYAGIPTATKYNYSQFSLWLNMGTQRGQKYISMKYKELEGLQRKFIYKTEPGMMGDGPQASNGRDGLAGHMLREICPEVRVLPSHGILAQNG